MTRDRWVLEFIMALHKKHRPNISLKFGQAVALQEWREGSDPKKAADEWAKRSAEGRKT